MAHQSTGDFRAWIYPKKSGIRIQGVLNTHGAGSFGVSYLVTIPARLTGRLRERRQFKDREAAEKWASDTFSGYRKLGEGFFALSDEERREIAANLPSLRKHGVSITEAVQFAVKHLRPEGRTKTVREVVKELVESKAQRFERGDLRERSYRDFRLRAERFTAAFEGRIASEVSGQEIKIWLTGLRLGSRSNQNYLAVVGEVFKLATQRRYVAFSPVDELTDTDRKELCGTVGEGKEPSILTPTEAEKLLTTALSHPELELLGAVVLALFCGLRTEELKRLDWGAVKITESPPVVTIGAKIAKKRRIRNVEIPVNAVRWLSLVGERKGPVSKNEHFNDHQKRFKKLLTAAGFEAWEPNAMRHSFGSYHYALHGNPLETSRLLGHRSSDQVLFDHYRALATKPVGKAYFDITPPARAAKVVKFA